MGLVKYRSLKTKEGEEMNVDKIPIKDILERASRDGFMHVKREILIGRTYRFPRRLKPFKVGIVSDTHLGSQMQQITLLHETYKIFQKEKIDKVFHCGDVVEGTGRQFYGQLYEMFLHGGDVLVDYTIKNYPKIPGITTYLIGGSHDYSYFKENGIDVLKKIAEERKDIKYLGMFGAYVNIGKVSFYLMHGDGSVAYARSYKMQKIIEQFPADKKPNVLLLGHYHVTNVLPQYRNVLGIQAPCYQTQTTYLRAKGLAPDIGFYILEVIPDVKGVAHFRVDYWPLYSPIEGDY